MLEGDSSSEGSSTSQGDTNAMFNDEHSSALSASNTGPFAAKNSNGEIDDIDHLFDGIEFNDVEVAGDGVVVYAKPQGADHCLANLANCASFVPTISSFNSSALTPYGPTAKVVFLQCPNNPGGDVYKGPYHLETINYPGRAHRGERCV